MKQQLFDMLEAGSGLTSPAATRKFQIHLRANFLVYLPRILIIFVVIRSFSRAGEVLCGQCGGAMFLGYPKKFVKNQLTILDKVSTINYQS
jgi:hypothetical protein